MRRVRRKRVEQIPQRRVRPVQIVQYQHQRRKLRQRLRKRDEMLPKTRERLRGGQFGQRGAILPRRIEHTQSSERRIRQNAFQLRRARAAQQRTQRVRER